jgi:hypothetical protein
MDFIVTDLHPATSSTIPDGSARATRPSSFNGPAVRKSFSSVMQGIRGEVKTGSTQETDSPQGAHKVEDRPDPKQSKSLHSAATQRDRAESTQVRTSDGGNFNDGEKQPVDSSGEESESVTPQNGPGSSAEGQMFVSMTSASMLHPGSQMMISEVQEAPEGLQVSECECHSVSASLPVPVMTDAPERPTESRAFENGTADLPPDVPEQTNDASTFQKGADSRVKQVTGPGISEGENDAKGKATDSLKTQATIETLPFGGAALPSDQSIPRIVQAPEAKLLPEGQFGGNLAALDRGEDSVAPHSTDNQPSLLMLAQEDQGETGPRTQGITPHGQPLVVDQKGLFSQSGQEHDGRQQGDPEPQLFQRMVVDLPSVNGRTTEQYAAVAQSQTMSVPTAPAPAVNMSSMQPTSPAPDLIQQPIASSLRSVVLDVAQPELGHVNIRVAMMNESVHAHFSTDRVEVGQFLINGQDRLQTTLQANGLDMGQFRVDIDRQNGGRSFQQGFFHEQGQSGHQGSQGGVKEQAQGWSDEMYRPLQGRLNVVA